MEQFFIAAVDAKNAVSLRQSAILHDIDYFLRKLAPLVRAYHRDVAAFGRIKECIDLLRKESNKDEHRRIDMYNLEIRLPGDSRFPPSFTYTHQASQAKVEELRQKRPMARYAARQFAEDGNRFVDLYED